MERRMDLERLSNSFNEKFKEHGTMDAIGKIEFTDAFHSISDPEKKREMAEQMFKHANVEIGKIQEMILTSMEETEDITTQSNQLGEFIKMVIKSFKENGVFTDAEISKFMDEFI